MRRRGGTIPDSLSDRQFETLRRVAPERRVPNRQGDGQHREEYATAIVGVDAGGNPITISSVDVGQLLRQQTLLMQEQSLLLLLIATQLGVQVPTDMLPDTAGTPVPGALAA